MKNTSKTENVCEKEMIKDRGKITEYFCFNNELFLVQ